MKHVIVWAQRKENICIFPLFETPSVGWRVLLFSILSTHSEMTIEQTDRYIPVPIRPSYGSCCQSSTVTKEAQVRHQVIPCRIFGGQSVTETCSTSSTTICLANIIWPFSHLHSFIRNRCFDSNFSRCRSDDP